MEATVRELTKDETAIFLSLLRSDEEQANQMYHGIIDEGGWVLKAIAKRFRAHTLEVDKKTMIMLLALGDGVVGICAKYVDDVAEKCKSSGITKLDFNLFSTKIYPHGVAAFS